jgi:hypothetical protein
MMGEDDTIEDDTIGKQCVGGKRSYTTEARYESTYVDYDLNEYKMYVDVQYAKNYQISSLNVAKLAYMLTYAHEKMGFANNNAVKNLLSVGHFVVAEDDYIFDNLYGGPDTGRVGAFIVVAAERVCWEIPKETNWSSVIRSRYYNPTQEGAAVIVHEMVHAVSYATYGYSDSGHENEFLWQEFGGDTLQGTVMDLYLKDFVDSNPWIDLEQF